MASGYWVAQQKKNAYKKLWLKRFPNIPDSSGIYVLTRVDENGLSYAYIGQASVSCLSRLAEHSMGYSQHIDRSLKTHKVWSNENPYGWKVECYPMEKGELDQAERNYIFKYANMGFQLRNKTAGGQDKGKLGISDNQGGLGYRKGVESGYEKCRKEIVELFGKYLTYSIKDTCVKKNGEYTEIAKKKLIEFENFIKERKDNEN